MRLRTYYRVEIFILTDIFYYTIIQQFPNQWLFFKLMLHKIVPLAFLYKFLMKPAIR